MLVTICDFVLPESLLSLSKVSPFWDNLCVETLWPRHIATALGVQGVRGNNEAPLSQYLMQQKPIRDSQIWFRILHNFRAFPAASALSICVQLGKKDSLTSLALEYAVSRQDIMRSNSIFAEHHLASRTHLYIPLLTEDAVSLFTGIPTHKHTPVLIRDTALSRKYFAVVKFRPCLETTNPNASLPTARESYVRQLVVKLIAKGLSVEEDEVRFYLDDNDFDVAKAYKQLLDDHNFASAL